MLSFRGWVHEEVSHRRKYLPGVGHEVVDITFDTIREKAEHRGRSALVTALGAQELYNTSAVYRSAMDQIVKVVVAGVFGEFPLTAAEQKAKLDALQVIFDNIPGWDFKVAADWEATVKASKPAKVTIEEVKKAAEQMKAAGYGKVVMGRNAGKSKSGLPAAQDAVKAEEDALGKLLGRVEEKSDELLGIKQKAKYEELVGIDPEDI